MDQLIYPVARLLANPRVFYAIAKHLDGPDPETLKEAFYDLLEHPFDHCELEECEFEADEVCFKFEDDGESVGIYLDTGTACILQPIEGEIQARITNETEMAATSAIYQRLVMAIEEANPELAGNVVLCSPPTPGNAFLKAPDGERFTGSFHLLTDPEKMFAFNVEIIDVNTDTLQAHIKPL